MVSSSVNALTVRMPCSDSCMVSMMSAVPVNWLWASPFTRLTSLRRISIAGGTTTRPTNDRIGSCITITPIKPISMNRSRPMALISMLRTSVMDFAPAVSRARNSDECRSEKNAMLSFISLANSRR